MRFLFVIALAFLGVTSFGQTTAAGRDSLANNASFQQKVKIAGLSAANDLMADAGQPRHVINYAQLIATAPNEYGGWITVLSYGCITNLAINNESSQGDIQFTVNSIFVKYAAAYYRVLPTP